MLPTNPTRKNIPIILNSDNDIHHDPLLASSVEKIVTLSSYQENSSKTSKNSCEFGNMLPTMHRNRMTLYFENHINIMCT